MSVAAWAGKYVGRPFEERGRGEGLDCHGLLVEVFRTELGVELPSHAGEYADSLDTASIEELVAGDREHWADVPEAQARPLDVVLLRVRSAPTHVAIVCGRRRMLHVLRGVGTVIERWDSPLWARRVAGFLRHRERRGA